MQKSLSIKNVMPGLVERGKIKIGMKGEWRKKKDGGQFQLPKKLDHFIITSLERGEDNNLVKDAAFHELIDDNEPKQLKIRLLYDAIDLNFQTRYACYAGRTLSCSGDGESARHLKSKTEYEDIPCPCPRQAPDYAGKDKCKINGTLSALLDEAQSVGGVWKFRTTSYNSVIGILSSLSLIKTFTGGALAGLPLIMTIQPKTVPNPIDGKLQTIQIVNIEFIGNIQTLKEAGLKLLIENKKHEIRVDNIEAEVRKLLTYEPQDLNDTVEETINEFYPDQNAEETPALVDPEKGKAPENKKEAPVPDQGKKEPADGAGPQTKPTSRRRGRPAKKAAEVSEPASTAVAGPVESKPALKQPEALVAYQETNQASPSTAAEPEPDRPIGAQVQLF